MSTKVSPYLTRTVSCLGIGCVLCNLCDRGHALITGLTDLRGCFIFPETSSINAFLSCTLAFRPSTACSALRRSIFKTLQEVPARNGYDKMRHHFHKCHTATVVKLIDHIMWEWPKTESTTAEECAHLTADKRHQPKQQRQVKNE